MLGLAAIAAGRAIVPDANRTGYVAGVLANVGTTLLLVGIVVLLERRIVDTAVRAVRNANDEARRAARDDLDAQIHDLEERIRTSWGSVEPRPKRVGWRTSTPAASSTPKATSSSGTDRSLEREGVSSLDEQTLRDLQRKMLFRCRWH